MDKKIEGKKIVVTGSCKDILGTKKDIEDLILARGGTFSNSLTLKTDILVVGDKSGSKKAKAENWVEQGKSNIKILTAKQFKRLLI